MTLARGVVVSVILHGVGRSDPTNTMDHLPVYSPTKNQMSEIEHSLISDKLNLVSFQCHRNDSLKSFAVFVLVKHGLIYVSAVQSMVKSTHFVSSGRPGHVKRHNE